MKTVDKGKLFWGGFTNDKLDSVSVDMGWGGYGRGDMVSVPAIFKTRKEARKKFQDVRCIIIFRTFDALGED